MIISIFHGHNGLTGSNYKTLQVQQARYALLTSHSVSARKLTTPTEGLYMWRADIALRASLHPVSLACPVAKLQVLRSNQLILSLLRVPTFLS